MPLLVKLKHTGLAIADDMGLYISTLKFVQKQQAASAY
jgi:hypothetical protein